MIPITLFAFHASYLVNITEFKIRSENIPKSCCSLHQLSSNELTCLLIVKAVANDLVGQVLARPLFLKVKLKFHFTKSK